jgi:hypothetical protein
MAEAANEAEAEAEADAGAARSTGAATGTRQPRPWWGCRRSRPVPFPIKRHGDSSPFVEIAIPGRTIFTFSLDIAGAYPWRRRPSTYPRYGLQTRRSMPDAPRALPRGLAAPTRGAGKPRCRDGVRRRSRRPHPRTDRGRARRHRAEDVRRPGLPRRRQHGGRGQRSGRPDGAYRSGGDRRLGRQAACPAIRDARPRDAGLATRRSGRLTDQARASTLGQSRRRVRPITSSEAVNRQAGAPSGSGRTTTVSATGITSSTGSSASSACFRIASSLEAW